MKTVQTKFRDEDRLGKLMFQQLFWVQFQLIELMRKSPDYERDFEEIIAQIDDLLGQMIDDYQALQRE